MTYVADSCVGFLVSYLSVLRYAVNMEILMGYSEKSDGSMYLDPDGFEPVNIKNRRKYFDWIGAGEMRIVAAGLVHGTRVASVGHGTPAYLPETDALVTAEPEILLTLTGADCFPLYFHDDKAGVIGLSHAGWRGVSGGIARNTIHEMIRLGADPSRLRLHIGPGICSKCFEVGEEVAAAFSAYPDALTREGNSARVDLPAIIRSQVHDLGISDDRISESGECTACSRDMYFSYRRDRPKSLETQVAYVGMKTN